MRYKYFVKPPADLYEGVAGEHVPGYSTYASYNYLGNGLIPYIKGLHFDAALELTRDYFRKANVIDFGCADGVFLLSLSRFFPRVCAIDQNPEFLAIAKRAVAALGLSNVDVLSNADHDIERIASGLLHDYQVMFLLETLEHVGDRERLYDSKMDFLEELFTLLTRDGVIVISVPNMVGIPFLVQRLALAAFGLPRERLSAKALAKAVVLKDTGALEQNWTPTAHLGFSHRKLERHLRRRFAVVAKRNLVFSLVYLVRQRTS